jgi:hypothetical protein
MLGLHLFNKNSLIQISFISYKLSKFLKKNNFLGFFQFKKKIIIL